MIKREIMKNVSFPIYKDTQERYLDFKKKHELTHDKTINLLLDKYEEAEENDRERTMEGGKLRFQTRAL